MKESKKEKVEKLYPDFVVTVQSMKIDELEQRINFLAKEKEKVAKAQEEDLGLQQAKETVKEMSAPYNDTKKAIDLQMSYVIHLLEEKGGNV